MSLIIKNAKLNELQAIKTMSSLLDPEKEGDEKEQKKQIENKQIFVAQIENNIIGFISLEFFGVNHPELPESIFISELFVLPKYRKQNIGSQLIEFVLKQKFPKQYKYFSVTHDPIEKHLTDFYKKFGFETADKTKSDNIKLMKLRPTEVPQ